MREFSIEGEDIGDVSCVGPALREMYLGPGKGRAGGADAFAVFTGRSAVSGNGLLP